MFQMMYSYMLSNFICSNWVLLLLGVTTVCAVQLVFFSFDLDSQTWSVTEPAQQSDVSQVLDAFVSEFFVGKNY